MIRISQVFFSSAILFLASCLLFLCSESAGAQKQKALPKTAQDKIQKALSESPGNKVTVFNREGEETAGATVSKGQAEKYNSLHDFLQSDKESPAQSCSDPVPTPPPPCIICSSGEVVCSKVSFSRDPRSPSDSAHSDSKTPEDQKPQ